MANNIHDQDDNGTIDGTAQSDVIYGGVSNGNADGGSAVNDTIDGGQSDDTIYAGDGDDLLFGGDAGDAAGGGGASKTVESFEFDESQADDVVEGSGPGNTGDSVLYRDVATADDGTPISVRITIVGQSDPDLEIELGYSDSYPVYLRGGNQGETVDIQVDFVDSNGDPVAIDSNFTFRDIDDTGSSGNEGVTFDTTDITHYAVSNSPTTNVQVDDRGDVIEFTTNSFGGLSNENLWTQVFFEGQSSLNFTLEARDSNAGYGFDTANFSNSPIITEVDASGDDLLYGGAGDDSALGGGGNDTIYGDEGQDTLDGGEGADTLFGGEGEDTLDGGEGADTLFGGEGNDRLLGSEGAAVLNGGAGLDTVDYSNSESGVTVDLDAGTATGGIAEGDQLSGMDAVIGSSHDDTIIGFDAEATGADGFTNVFYGGAGNDSLDGKGGADTLFGGDGADSIDGGSGNDSIDGGADADTIDAGSGDDSVTGGAGSDSIDGGSGNDTISGGEGSDTIYGGDGDDRIVLDDSSGTDTIFGGDGQDHLDASGVSGGVSVDLSGSGGTVTTDNGQAVIDGIDEITLTSGDDTVTNSGSVDNIKVNVGAGNDSIQTGDGDDVISAGAGNDTIDAGLGNNVVSGGSGADTYVIRSADFSDLGTPDEIREAILETNATGIEGWKGIKGEGGTAGSTEGSTSSNAELFDVKDLGKEIDDALEPLMGKKAAGDAEKIAEDAIEEFLTTTTQTEISAWDISEVVYNALLPEIGIIKAGVAGMAAYEEAGDQIATADQGDPKDLKSKDLAEDVEDALRPEIGNDGAKDIKDTVEDVVDQIKIANEGGTITPTEVADQVYEIVQASHGDALADLARSTAFETAEDQLGTFSNAGGEGSGGGGSAIGEDILARATHTEITDFELGTDTLDLSNLDYLGETGLSTNDVKIVDTAGDGSGDAVMKLPDGSTITLRGVSVYDLDPETLEEMGFNASDDATSFQNEFLEDAGQIGGGGGDDAIAGTSSDETIDGGSGADTLILGGGSDTVFGGTDADQIVVSDDFDGSSIDGGSGGTDRDELDFSELSTGVTVTATTDDDGTIDDNAGSSATFGDIEDFTGTSLDDEIATGTGDNTVDAGDGNDSVDGGSGDDVLTGGAGNDTASGGDGSDLIYGGEGDDRLSTGIGEDTLFGGAGNDLLTNSAGNDTLFGGTGDDSLVASEGNDLLYGGVGNDALFGGDDDDTLYGGAGNDTIDVGRDSDVAYGGAGADEFEVSLGDNTLYGGDDQDSFNVGFGDDTIFGGEGGTDSDTLSGSDADDALTVTFTGDEAGTFVDQDGDSGLFVEIEAVELTSGADTVDASAASSAVTVVAGSGADTVTGGSGDDVVYGGGGNDEIDGAAGNDTLSGGAGNDTLTGGAGNDTLTGGSGNDVFELSDSGGTDSITDFTAGDDLIDSSALTDVGNVLTNQDGTVTADEIVVTGGGGSNQVLTFPGGEVIEVPDGTIDTSTTQSQFASLVSMGVPPCFAPGTRILTGRGEVAVEDLRIGDMVQTARHGPQPVRWIGVRTETFTERDARNKPILISAGALGGGFPTRDLVVSPQHRMLITGKLPETMFGTREVLATAKNLTALPGVRRMLGKSEIRYFALLFDRHEIIFAEGSATESFRPGPVALRDMAQTRRDEIYQVYPDLKVDPVGGLGPAAARLLNGRESRALARRFAKRLARQTASKTPEEKRSDRLSLNVTQPPA
ncbi:MAG: Hint domain-containing protein [Pseudomonadota bacterium]